MEPRLLRRDFDGFADQKNFIDEAASHDWILSLDADEALSDRLSEEIQRIKRTGPSHDAYRFPRKARYMGKWILHSGWYPDPKVRFYDRRKARWTGLVHESVSIDGTVGELSGDLLHYTCRSLTEHLHTVDRYTTLAAREMISQGRRAHLGKRAPLATLGFFSRVFSEVGVPGRLRGPGDRGYGLVLRLQ